MFTESHGLKSFIFKGVRKQKHKISPNLFEHLSLVEVVFRSQENKDIQQHREVRVLLPFKSIPYDIKKSSMALFINELIYKSLKEEESNPALFQFLFTSIEFLDYDDNTPVDFHVRFAVQLTRHLGFFPGDNYSAVNSYFDLKEGVFMATLPGHEHYIEPPLSRYFYSLAHGNASERPLQVSNPQRRLMIKKIGEYYQLHLPGFTGLKSPEILEKVLE